jgi:hypothetical protein
MAVPLGFKMEGLQKSGKIRGVKAVTKNMGPDPATTTFLIPPTTQKIRVISYLR